MHCMLISVHIPKSGGQTFEKYLGDVFGSRRLLLDYGPDNIMTQEASLKRQAPIPEEKKEKLKSLLRRSNLGITLYNYYLLHKNVILPDAASKEDIECIHGHFFASKYLSQYPDAPIVTWMRDPVQRLISNYEFWLRTPEAAKKWFREEKPSFEGFALSSHMKNEMIQYLDGVPLDSLAFVGITEDYTRSILKFNRFLRDTYGINTFPKEISHRNVNPQRVKKTYDIDPSLEERIREFHDLDIKLYESACTRHRREIEGQNSPEGEPSFYKERMR